MGIDYRNHCYVFMIDGFAAEIKKRLGEWFARRFY